jgi:phospholipid/cholesterol/gamma-HCH transport system ATP-binding protein
MSATTVPTAAPGGDATAHIALDAVRMSFGERRVFEALSCSFPRGRVAVILGGSGSGKSTMLRLIGGLVRPQSGRIVVDGDEVTGLSERRLYGVRTKLGMMFQNGALLDSLTVFDNLAFPLREHTRLSETEIAAAVHARLTAVGLADVDELLPRQLSGGMMKRVALARATMMDPVILLCDEPFSGLDPISSKRIEALLTGLNRELGITVIVVSHDISSTMRMADWVVILLKGRAVQGTPADIRSSRDPAVANFLNPGADDGAAIAAVAPEARS